MGFIKREARTFVTILSDGSLRIPSTSDNPDAVRREYKTSKGVEGVKFELVQDAYEGLIKSVNFHDAGFGEMLNIAFEREEGQAEGVIISVSTENNFGTDLMRKFPLVDFNKKVSLNPFSFLSDAGKDIRGVTIRQDSIANSGKVQDFFFDKENKIATNGIPVPQGDVKAYTKDDWKIYFMQVRKFLVYYTNMYICPLVEDLASKRPQSEAVVTSATPPLPPTAPVGAVDLAPEPTTTAPLTPPVATTPIAPPPPPAVGESMLEKAVAPQDLSNEEVATVKESFAPAGSPPPPPPVTEAGAPPPPPPVVDDGEEIKVENIPF